MAATIGSQIRAYFRSQISTATGLPLESILKSPRFHLDGANFPLISVYTHSDKSEDPNQISNRRHGRFYTVAVEINVEGRVEEDSTDDLAVAVRNAILSGDGTLGGLCKYVVWTSQDWGAKENNVATSATLLLFACHYIWTPGA